MWAPLNLRNIFLQNEFIKNMKPKAQITKPLEPNSLKKGGGGSTILHRKKAYTTKGYQ